MHSIKTWLYPAKQVVCRPKEGAEQVRLGGKMWCYFPGQIEEVSSPARKSGLLCSDTTDKWEAYHHAVLSQATSAHDVTLQAIIKLTTTTTAEIQCICYTLFVWLYCKLSRLIYIFEAAAIKIVLTHLLYMCCVEFQTLSISQIGSTFSWRAISWQYNEGLILKAALHTCEIHLNNSV